MPRKSWSTEEDTLLSHEYPVHGLTVDLLCRLGRSERAARHRIATLDLKQTNPLKRGWNADDVQVLRDVYPQEGASQELANRLNRTRSSIQIHANRLGLKIPKKIWTPEEESIFRERYPIEGGSIDLQKILNRTRPMLHKHAQDCGLSKPDAPRWSAQEDARIKEVYPTRGASAALAQEINRTQDAIRMRARKLGAKRIEWDSSWTKEEDSFIERHYPKHGGLLVLPNKTADEIRGRAKLLGVKRAGFFWTDEQIKILRDRYFNEGASVELSKTLDKTRQQIKSKAVILGLNCSMFVRSVETKQRMGCGEKHHCFRGYKCIRMSYISHLREKANQRGFECPLLDGSQESFEYLHSIISDACPLSGLPVIFPQKDNDKKATASLDRIDSLKGYIRGNVQWVHKDVNRMKWNLSSARFIEIANRIAKIHPVVI